MKKFMLLAGVAALAMATSAHAGSFQQGASSILGVPVSNTSPTLGKLANAGAVALGGEEIASWIDISGSVAGNTGTASATDGATFSLTGTVSMDCSYYSGNANLALNFGTIGINTLDSVGIDEAFDMAGPLNATIESNVAGCNTKNTVSITKGNGANGMVSNNTVSFDQAQFTNKIPYSVTASWTGIEQSSAGAGEASEQALNVSETQGSASLPQGAWKSHLVLDINAQTQDESLISGTYTDTVTVTLTASA
jgi:hypothetical protein